MEANNNLYPVYVTLIYFVSLDGNISSNTGRIDMYNFLDFDDDPPYYNMVTCNNKVLTLDIDLFLMIMNEYFYLAEDNTIHYNNIDHEPCRFSIAINFSEIK